jgi:hypothetical protein
MRTPRRLNGIEGVIAGYSLDKKDVSAELKNLHC